MTLLPSRFYGERCYGILASFPGRLPLRSLYRIRDLWTARRSGRRPGITSTSSNRKVDSIMTLWTRFQ